MSLLTLIASISFLAIAFTMFNQLPWPDIPADVLDTISLLMGYLKSLNNYLPIDEIMVLFTLVILVELTLWTVRFLLFIVDQFKGAGTKFDRHDK